MARIAQTGFELNSVTAGMEFTNATGTIQSTIVRSGTYAARANAVANTKVFRADIFASDQTTICYSRVYIYVASLPLANQTIMDIQNVAGSISVCSIRLTTTGTLRLLNSGFVTVGGTSATLSTGQWYMIELKADATTTPGAIEGKLDGVSFASGANDIQGSWGRARVGILGATTADVYFDDWAVNDNSGSFQNTYPGSGKIIHLKPSATGDVNGFLVQVGGTAGAGNNFTRVNEIPPDDATSYNGSAVLSSEDLFNCDDSGLATADTINTVLVGVRFADLVGADATAAFKVEIEKAASGTKTQSAAIIPNSVNWRTNSSANVPQNYPIVTYQDPDGSNWQQTTLDSMQIGYIQTATNIRSIAISSVWASVDYTPSTGRKGLSALGVG